MTPALLTAVDCSQHVHLIIGSNPLASARCAKSIEVGAVPKLITPPNTVVHYGLVKKLEDGAIAWIQREFHDEDLTTLGRDEVDYVVDAVFVTLGRKHPQSTHIANLCRRLRIPINVADAPSLCSFTLLSTYTDGPLQIGVTTSGRGCKLSSRIRREIVSSLPPDLGAAITRLGDMKKRLYEEDNTALHSRLDEIDEEEDDGVQPSNFNQLVSIEDLDAARNRRMRWLSQICEYWPLKRLCNISDVDVSSVLASSKLPSMETNLLPSSMLDLRGQRQRGAIILAGSGPGHPELLTMATLSAIKNADVILADKLVPAAVLELIPRRTTVHIARKFPGNAEAAQDELLEMGLAGVESGKTVLRLKQGDPYLFGRGGEEVLWFREKGWEPVVLPGVTSALSAPLFAGIPVTQRSVADQVLICTGTGRAGKPLVPPEYVASRTVVFLMALHRLPSLVESLVVTRDTAKAGDGIRLQDAQGSPCPTKWPSATPCAIVERASCRDQRVIRSTLQYICLAFEELGSLPPGLLVVGNACGVLHDMRDKWTVEEGFSGMESLTQLAGELIGEEVL
ncbi:uroporphyrin-III C-methyltransferase [Tothia fuscella]|uniref:Uroporphyrin-III C-methyltransferase n=1 Tax=Tothia fuscella TaxID=1048955 RepID=A0A9P4U109_9PEZI|nr:uroporphyrin-III C-methyltransferase [Tothia fuscella]